MQGKRREGGKLLQSVYFSSSYRVEIADASRFQEYFAATARRTMKPYSRSIHMVSQFKSLPPSLVSGPNPPLSPQSLFTSPSSIFLTTPPHLFAISFLTALTPIPLAFWTNVIEIKDAETHWSSPGRKTCGWLEKLGLQLGKGIAQGALNRARGKRMGVKNREALLALLDEVRCSFTM